MTSFNSYTREAVIWVDRRAMKEFTMSDGAV